MKQTALLASPVYIGQAQGGGEKKHLKRGAKIKPGASLRVFWVCLLSRPEDVFSFACQIKLSCNTGLPIASNFAAVRQNRGNYTLP